MLDGESNSLGIATPAGGNRDRKKKAKESGQKHTNC